MAQFRDVVDFGVVAQNIVESLNRDEIIKFVVNVIQQLDNKVDTKGAEILTQVNETKQLLEEVKKKAEILESFELGQIEEALKKALENLDALGLFETLCIGINGQPAKLSDFVQALINFANKKPVYVIPKKNPDSGLPDQIQVMLLDGTVLTLPVKLEEIKDEKTQDVIGYKVSAQTEKWIDGMVVEFEAVLKMVKDEYSFSFGKFNLVQYEVDSYKNPILAIELTPCQPATPEQTTPDLNQDGTKGIPTTGGN